MHPTIRWFTEAPLPNPGDQRAWDALIAGGDWRYGIETETSPNEGQAVARRLELKRRDGQARGVILVLPATRRTRLFLAGATPTLAPHFQIDARTALARLGAGLDPGGSAIVVL